MLRGIFSHIAPIGSFKKSIKFQIACIGIIIIIVIAVLV